MYINAKYKYYFKKPRLVFSWAKVDIDGVEMNSWLEYFGPHSHNSPNVSP